MTDSHHDTSERQTKGSVGALLRVARERLGDSTADVARALRIRHPYIVAIEAGDSAALPGFTYAIGFVRSYASYLGMNAEEIVRWFKDESEAVEQKSELAFPVPMSERRLAGPGALFLAIILLGGAYGGWYMSTQADRQSSDLVPPVPDTIRDATDPADTPGVAAPDSTMSQPAAPVGEDPAAESPSPTAADTPPTTEPPAAETPVAEPPAPETPVVQTPVVEPPVVEPAVAVAEPPASDPEIPEPAVADAAVPDVPEPPAPPVADAATPAPPAPPAPAPAARASRIELKARMDVWVAIRDRETDKVVRMGILHPGESYDVPDGRDLVMMTGNAGGMDIFVDGALTKTLGPVGAVRRNIALDAQQLIDGTAYRQGG